MAENPEAFPAMWRDRPRPVDMRYVTELPYRFKEGREPTQLVWFRADGTLPDDPVKHTCLLAYMSDMTLLDTAIIPHISPYRDDMMNASLDHLMWFHRPFRADEWMLYATDSPSASGALARSGRAMRARSCSCGARGTSPSTASSTWATRNASAWPGRWRRALAPVRAARSSGRRSRARS